MHKVSVMTEAPVGTKGLVKEIRVRWLLEELGEVYEEMKFRWPDLKKEPYLKLQPFGQVPAYQNDEVEMFESGAILIYLADEKEKFLPKEGAKRAKVLTWLFAVMNTLEPYIISRIWIRFSFEQNEVTKQILDQSLSVISKHLTTLEGMMENDSFVAGEFSIADIIFTTVLRNIALTPVLENHPKLKKYLASMEERPAFKKALSDHSKLYEV